MGALMKYYLCRVCGKDCWGLFTDGDIFDEEVCSEKCLNILKVNDPCVNCDVLNNPHCD